MAIYHLAVSCLAWSHEGNRRASYTLRCCCSLQCERLQSIGKSYRASKMIAFDSRILWSWMSIWVICFVIDSVFTISNCGNWLWTMNRITDSNCANQIYLSVAKSNFFFLRLFPDLLAIRVQFFVRWVIIHRWIRRCTCIGTHSRNENFRSSIRHRPQRKQFSFHHFAIR